MARPRSSNLGTAFCVSQIIIIRSFIIKAIIAGLFIFALTQGAVAGHHEEGEGRLHRKPRQATSILNVTSADMGGDKTTITAPGKMGEYGKVYVTYSMT